MVQASSAVSKSPNPKHPLSAFTFSSGQADDPGADGDAAATTSHVALSPSHGNSNLSGSTGRGMGIVPVVVAGVGPSEPSREQLALLTSPPSGATRGRGVTGMGLELDGSFDGRQSSGMGDVGASWHARTTTGR